VGRVQVSASFQIFALELLQSAGSYLRDFFMENIRGGMFPVKYLIEFMHTSMTINVPWPIIRFRKSSL